MSGELPHRGATVFARIAVMVCVTATPGFAQSKPTGIPQSLGVAINLYATDSRTMEVEDLLRRVVTARPATHPEGATARYYLGRLHHRNYYMFKRAASLDTGVDTLRRLHDAIDGGGPTSRWYAEARFYKGLMYMEQGKWEDACEAVEHIDARIDATVEIDYLIWSPDKRSLDTRLPTTMVKQAFLEALTRATAKYAPDCTPSAVWRKDHRDSKVVATVIAALQRAFEQARLR